MWRYIWFYALASSSEVQALNAEAQAEALFALEEYGRIAPRKLRSRARLASSSRRVALYYRASRIAAKTLQPNT